jgi:hypothetical protein
MTFTLSYFEISEKAQKSLITPIRNRLQESVEMFFIALA